MIVFASLSELDGDRNRDFEQGHDQVDLSGLAGALTFLETGAFTGTAGEMRFRETAHGHSVLQIDADGDGTHDAQLVMLDVLGLTAQDFVL